MKKLLLTLLLVLTMASLSWAAAGTVTITSDNIRVVDQLTRKTITLSWVAGTGVDAGTVPTTTITASTYGIIGWYLYSAETNPGTTAPTDNYDIVLNDADIGDIAGALLINRDSTATEFVCLGNSPHGYPVIRGNIAFTLTNNSVSASTGTLILTFIAN